MLVSQFDLIATMIVNVEPGHTVGLRPANIFTLYPASPRCAMVNGQCIFVRSITFYCFAFDGTEGVWKTVYSVSNSFPLLPYIPLKLLLYLKLHYNTIHCALTVGEACPASWTPGKDTIKTNPYESKEYFKAHYAGDTL